MFALVDCNNFYASCERIFRPDLRNKPIIVLSNNDGCVVARCPASKQIGIKMGVPFFQIRSLVREHGIEVFSSNYSLYADMSTRVMQVLERQSPNIEIYSIDEAFIDFRGFGVHEAIAPFAMQLRRSVLKETGIQVCVGVATTKTLAKLANHAAKKYPATRGVADITTDDRRNKLLAISSISDVWGIGSRTAAKLNALGIATGTELLNANLKHLRKLFGVTLERTVIELSGTPCFELEVDPPAKQQIVCSRSFGAKVIDLPTASAAISAHAATAAARMRRAKLKAFGIAVFISTSRFDDRQYSPCTTTRFIIATEDTRLITKTAIELLTQIWRHGYSYSRAGVMLTDLSDTPGIQTDLFAEPQTLDRKVMKVFDEINKKYPGKAQTGAALNSGLWGTKAERKSPKYTTCWADLPTVR